MNSNSLLCRYLSEHPEWETSLKDDFNLKIRREGPYAIFNYGYEARFSDPLVQEARGIILDTECLEVVCWPFRKFGNFNEEYADPIDWKTACVQEKVDGSIIKLWFSQRQDRWIFSTNSNIDAANAPIEGSARGHTFLDAILSAENYSDIHTDRLDRKCTYIFELVGPETQVVIPYTTPLLYHTGTRNNVTGEEYDENIGIVQPLRYPLRSLADCMEAARKLNAETSGVAYEGFVVVDANWHRVKIKSPDYLVRHKLSGICLSRDNAVELLLGGKFSTLQLCRIRPKDAAVLKYYDWQLEELFVAADRVAELARAIYKECSFDRKAVAKMLQGHPLSGVGFTALYNTDPGRVILLQKPLSHLCRLIRPYSPLSDSAGAFGRGDAGSRGSNA